MNVIVNPYSVKLQNIRTIKYDSKTTKEIMVYHDHTFMSVYTT